MKLIFYWGCDKRRSTYISKYAVHQMDTNIMEKNRGGQEVQGV